MSSAARLAQQRLDRSAQRTSLRSSQTSSSAYGAWFTPDANPAPRRQLLPSSPASPPSRASPAQPPTQQMAAARIDSSGRPPLNGAAKPPPNGAAKPAYAPPKPAASAYAPPAATAGKVEREAAAGQSIASTYEGMNARKSMVLTDSDLATLGPPPEREAAAAREAAARGLTETGHAEVPETSSAAFASVSREGALHVNHDRGAASVGPDGVLFAMLDGHGNEGAAVSTYCQRNLFSAFAAAAAAGLRNVEAMGTAFAQTAAGLARSGIDARFSGTTAILAKLDRAPDGGRVVTVGFVGDSRAVLGRSRVGARKEAPLMTVPLTKDHKPDDPKERQRLQECKAIVRPSRVPHPTTGVFVEVGCARVWDSSQVYGVAMSRSLGDMQCHPFVIPTPDTSVRRAARRHALAPRRPPRRRRSLTRSPAAQTRTLDDKDRLLVMATDGVWDVMENDEAVQMATNGTPKEAAAEIVAECARRWDKQMAGRRDDITCLVADLTHPDLLHY